MNKTAIVTGGTKGIGKAIVQKLSNEGYTVLTCGRKDSVDEAILSKAFNGNVEFKVVNLDSQNEVSQFIEYSKSRFTHINVLVNNAGIYIPKNLLDDDLPDLESSLNINLKAPYMLIKGLIPLLETQKSHIFNIASIVSKEPAERAAAYTISKFGLDALGKVAKPLLALKNIHLCTLYPGATFGSSWGIISEQLSSDMVQPESIAETIFSIINLRGNVNIDEIIINTNRNPFT